LHSIGAEIFMLDVVNRSLPADKAQSSARRKRRRVRLVGSALAGALSRLLIPLFVLGVVFFLVGLTFRDWDRWIGQAAVQVTDDAYVRAEITRLSSQIAGPVRSIDVQDFQKVKAGDLLMEIDPRDYQAQVAQTQANVDGAKAVLANLENQIALQRATITQAEAQVSSATSRRLLASQERERQEALLQTTFGTRQKVEQVVAQDQAAQADLEASKAALEAQKRQLDVQIGTRQQRAADLASTQALLDAAKLRLSYTRIVAATDGVVSERQVQQGDYVTIGSNLISVVPLPNVYVVANYKETQLTRFQPGQLVDLSVDTFPGTAFKGRVERISPASGSQFSLLPADNATGNFTKVVQRVPVRIQLDRDETLLAKLRPGMSVTTRVHTTGEPDASGVK
jgi:membrane fusion protein (multidrug efflux system)